MLRRILAYLSFGRQCLVMLADERKIVGVFIVLAVVAALTEGVAISLLVPILEAQGGEGAFSRIPALGDVSRLFGDLSPSARIQAVAVAMAVVVVLRNLLVYVVNMLSATIPLRLEQKFNLRSFAALMSVELAYISENDYGTLSNSLGGWSQRLTTLLADAAGIVYNALIVAVYIVLMLFVSWQVTALALLFIALMSLILRWLTSGPLRRAGERWSSAASRVNQVVMESVLGTKVIRLVAAEPLMMSTYSGALEQAMASQRHSAKIHAIASPLLSACAGLVICMLLFAAAAIRADEPTTWVASILLLLPCFSA